MVHIMKKSIKSVLSIALVGSALVAGYKGGQLQQQSVENTKIVKLEKKNNEYKKSQSKLISITESTNSKYLTLIYRQHQLATMVNELAPNNAKLEVNELDDKKVSVNTLAYGTQDDTLTLIDGLDNQIHSSLNSLTVK